LIWFLIYTNIKIGEYVFSSGWSDVISAEMFGFLSNCHSTNQLQGQGRPRALDWWVIFRQAPNIRILVAM